MTGINAGDLDREITLITGVKTQDDGTGEEVITWDVDAATSQVVWAAWLPGGTREQWQAQSRLGAYIDGVWRLSVVYPRPTPDGMRLQDDQGRMYDIRGVVEIGRGDGYELAVVAHGEGV